MENPNSASGAIENPVSMQVERLPERQQHWFQGSTIMGEKAPLPKLLEELSRQAAAKKDYVVDTRNLKMVLATELNGVGLSFPLGDTTLTFGIRDNCHDQIAEKCGIPSRYYGKMISEAPALLTTNVNHWMPGRERRMVRTLDGMARALVSDRFRTLDNVDLFFAAAGVFKEVGAEIVRADLSEDRFYMRAIRPDVRAAIKAGDEICGGITLSNSETGRGAMSIEQFGLRLKCMNGMVGEAVFSQIHLGARLEEGIYQEDTITKTTEAIFLQARDHIKKAFEHSTVQEWANKLSGAQKVSLPDPTRIVNGAWTGLNVSMDERNAILTHLFGDGEGVTQFGLSQAMTATARDLGDAARRHSLESLGFTVGTAQEPEFNRLMAAMTAVPRRVSA